MDLKRESNRIFSPWTGPTLEVARSLLGLELSSEVNGVQCGGMIVEVEAYGPENDLACHATRGLTPRCAPMFEVAGTCYVYLVYGMHHCVNIVTEEEGVGAAVLIRAIEPTLGTEHMMRRRGAVKKLALTNGPAKLCQALAIGPQHNGLRFSDSQELSLRPGIQVPDSDVVRASRIGITKSADLPWRFYIRGNPYVSRP